jgi:hypothetical protein
MGESQIKAGDIVRLNSGAMACVLTAIAFRPDRFEVFDSRGRTYFAAASEMTLLGTLSEAVEALEQKGQR